MSISERLPLYFNWHIICFVLLLGFSSCKNDILRPAGCNPPPEFKLYVPMIPQQAFNWCWAATGEMCMEYLNVAQFGRTGQVCQCQQADNYFPGLGCCDGNTSDGDDPCAASAYFGNNGTSPCGWPNFPNFAFGKYNKDSTLNYPNAALSFYDLQTEIGCNHRPVIFGWTETILAGVENRHFMVVYGYSTDENGVQWVDVHDPAQGLPGHMLYTQYVEDFPNYSHYFDYFSIIHN